jgi:hypothetical protein
LFTLLEAVRNEEQTKLTSSSMPIDKAMEASRSAAATAKLATEPSGDLSVMSGWVHEPYVPRPVVAAATEETPLALRAEGAPKGADDSAPELGR